MGGFSLDQFSDRAVDSLWTKFADSISGWMQQYPWLNWLLGHPRWFLFLLVLSLLLLWGLFGAIARLFQEFWIQLPSLILKLFTGIGGWTMQQGVAALQRRPKSDRQTELKELLEQLEANRRQQDELLQRVKTLLQESGER
jgi:hypothetical protein